MKLEEIVVDQIQNDEILRKSLRDLTTEVTARLLKSNEKRIELVIVKALNQLYAKDIEDIVKDCIKEVVTDIVRKQLGNGNGHRKEG